MQEKKTYHRQWGLLPQAGCCYGPSVRQVVNVEMAKQVVPVVILLLLLLLDGDEALSCFFLPLGMLVKSVLDLLLVLLDGGEPSVEMSVLHLLLMITYGMVMVTTGQRRTCVLPGGHWRSPHKTVVGSSQNCCPAIAHLGPIARNSLNDAEKAAPTQHAQVGAYGKIPAGPSLHAEDGAPRKVLLYQILCSR